MLVHEIQSRAQGLSPAHKVAVLTPLKDIAKLNLQLKDSLKSSKAQVLEEVAMGKQKIWKSKAIIRI